MFCISVHTVMHGTWPLCFIFTAGIPDYKYVHLKRNAEIMQLRRAYQKIVVLKEMYFSNLNYVKLQKPLRKVMKSMVMQSCSILWGWKLFSYVHIMLHNLIISFLEDS